MSKKKTRAQKIKASVRRQENEPKGSVFSGPRYEFVNREFGQPKLGSASHAQNSQMAKNSGQNEILASSPKDLLKTFIISAFILGLEAVLYFAWK